MIIRKNDLKVSEVDKLRGGKGTTEIKYLLDKDGLEDLGKMFSILTLKKGCGLGYHEHIGDFEAIYILQGQATYNDNKTTHTLYPGDFCITRNGESHCIENEHDEDVVFVALVLNSK